MELSNYEIERLMKMLRLTSDEELNCEQCLCRVAEFAEQKLSGKSANEGYKLVEQHLAVCSECREEFEALQRSLNELNDD